MGDRTIDGVIAALTADLTPVKPLPRIAVRARRTAALSIAPVVAGVLLYGVRRDLPRMSGDPLFLAQALLTLATALLSTIAALRLSVPGIDGDRRVRYAPFLALAGWTLLLAAVFAVTGGSVVTLAAEPLHVTCGAVIFLLSITPALVIGHMVRRGAPLDAGAAGGLASLAAAAFGAVGVQAICPVQRPAHLLVSHLLPVVALTVAGALASRAVSRRRSRAWAVAALLAVMQTTALLAQAVPPAPATAPEPAVLEGFAVVSTTAGYVPRDAFLTFIHDAEAGVKQKGMLEGRGPIAVVVIIFLGGLALNLTPCVLPMIPINLAIIGAGAQAGSRRRGWLLGGAYGAAMAVVYGVLGAAVVITAGTFGTLNSSPWFNAAIAALFVFLGLAMFDVVAIDLSRFSSRMTVDPSRRGSMPLAFFMGAVAALLAGACVAPVVIQVILLSSRLYAGGTTVALALPLLLGLGMALPWPFAGAGLAALPKPGAWMVRVKQILGIAILATAVYYGYEAVGLFRNRSAVVPGGVSSLRADGWYDSLPEGLAIAARDRKPVLIDMWATWCKNCVVMDSTTFKDPAVIAALDGYVKIKFQAEDMEQGDAKRLLDRFESFGLPTYAILRSR